MTVSAKQAKLIYASGKFTLINYSGTNPTKVNDSELEINGSVDLADGDRIEMGEIVFEFKSH
jgi:predicted component of type VI protein secretion system